LLAVGAKRGQTLISDEVSSLNVDLNAINKVVFDLENATASHVEEGLKRDEKKLNIEYQDKLDAMAETYAAVLKHYVNSKT
jgi:hypothetical protein